MKPVLSSLRKKGHQVMNYLDDFFLVGDTFEECEDAVIDTCDLLIKLGFSMHPDKSQFTPVQKRVFKIYFRFHINDCVFDRYKTAKYKNTN